MTMIVCGSNVEAYIVRYTYHGMPDKMITLDKVKADAYAIQYRGIVDTLHCPLAHQPDKQETTSVLPWDGETTITELLS